MLIKTTSDIGCGRRAVTWRCTLLQAMNQLTANEARNTVHCPKETLRLYGIVVNNMTCNTRIFHE